jgi:hypothetical protein
MRTRSFFPTALLGLMLILPVVAPAAAQSGKPAVVLTLAPYDQLRSDFFYLSRLAGQDLYAVQLDMLIELRTGNTGLRGVDRKKPMGGYGWIGPRGDDSAFVLLIPVTDQATFLDLLGNFNIRPAMGGDGVYSADVEKIRDPVYLRFANGYAYITTRDKRVLADDRLLAPDNVLAGPGCANATGQPCRNGSEVSLTLNIDRIPDAFREQVMTQFERGMEEAQARNPPRFETEWQRKFRVAVMNEISGSVRRDLSEAGEISLRLDLDRAAGEIALIMRSAARPGTSMAARIREVAQARSVTAGLIDKDAAISGTVQIIVPERLREIFGPVLDGARAEALTKAKDESERAAVAATFDAFMPTLKSTEFDGTFNLLGPGANGLYTFVGGVRLKDGARLEQAFRRQAPNDPATDVRLDVDRVGTVSIHRLLLAPKMDSDGRRIFGDNTMHVAFRDDAMFFAIGSGGLGAIKDALTVAPSIGKAMDFQMTLSQILPLAGQPGVQELVRKIFADKKDGDDRIRLTVEGGDASTMRLIVKTKLIEYLGRFSKIPK